MIIVIIILSEVSAPAKITTIKIITIATPIEITVIKIYKIANIIITINTINKNIENDKIQNYRNK
jgi:hypothetical protein